MRNSGGGAGRTLSVALIASKFPPDVGGGETHIRDLANGLAARGHRVRVLTGCGTPDGHDGSAAYEITSLPALRAFASGSSGLRELLPPLFAWLSERDDDVVHVFNHLPALAVGLVRRGIPAPVAISLFETLERGVRVFDLWRQYDLERAVQGAMLSASAYDLWICESDAYLEWACLAGADRTRLCRTSFCIDAAKFAPPSAGRRIEARRSYDLGDRIVIGFPSRLVPRKGFEDVVQALVLLRTLGAPIPTVLIPRPTDTSDAAYVASIRALIDTSDLAAECVMTPTAHTVDDMTRFYAACDFIIQPAHAEGLGIALLEAMAMRVPVLCSRIDGHIEAIAHGRTGFLFEPGDARAIASVIGEAMAGPIDRIVDAAFQFVRTEFSQKRMVERHEAAYACIARPPRSHAAAGGR